MLSKKRLLKSCKLYLILDREVNDYDKLFDIAAKAIAGGVDIIQLRDKKGSAKDIYRGAKELLKIVENKVPLIINDRLDIALAVGADGVHLGQDDLPVAVAKRMVKSHFIVGTSCQSFEHCQRAIKEKVDYIGFGSVFKTLTKPQRAPMNLQLLKKVNAQFSIPIFCIGGIGLEDISLLKAMDVRRVAVCRAICKAKDVVQTVNTFKKLLNINH